LIKKSAKGLHYFGLDRGMLEQAAGLETFLYLAAQNFELFSNIKK
jgi:hypothetical protein